MAKAMGLFLPSNPSFYPTPTPTPTQTQTHFCYPAKTLNPNRNSKNNAFFKTYSIPPRRGRGTESESESESEWCPVPLDQQPIIEYQNLSTSFPFSWASADLVEYFSRLMATGVSFGLFVGLPVSAFGAHSDPVNLVLGSVSTALFVVTMAVLRMYLGWAYVGNRLLSATVEYEETGWYDGQIWVKSAEVLARDRLLGSFQVKPVLSRLKNSLVALAISLFICVAFLINHEGSQKELRNLSYEARDRVVPGVYNDDSARSFEPDAFHNVPDLAPE